MKNIEKFIGTRLAKERKRQGITQEQLSEMTGISPNYIGLLENGKYNMKVKTFYKIALALNYPLEKLFKGF